MKISKLYGLPLAAAGLFLGTAAWADSAKPAAQPAAAMPAGITPVDESLKPASPSDDAPAIYQDMGVVQPRAMRKGGRFLLSTYGSFDYSDGPYSNYSLNLNPGYAFSDFFEFYVNWGALYFSQARPIVASVAALQLANGQQANLTESAPKSAIGGELIWAPLYGKDSMGARTILRSDTFFKLGVSRITYTGDTGLKITAGIGKTFFLAKWAGLRVTADLGRVQTIIEGVKNWDTMFFVEVGPVVYF